MRRESTEIVNRLGLHARAAARLVKVAGAYSARVALERDGRSVDAKSIMAVMMLAASKGTRLDVVTEGEDEDRAMEAVLELIADRFGEDA